MQIAFQDTGCRMQGATEVAPTVLDVLGYLDGNVCGYEIDGEVNKRLPVTAKLAKANLFIKYFLDGKKKSEELQNMTNFRKTAVNTLNL